MATAIFLILLDSLEASRLGWIDQWIYAFGAESARAILSAIAGSMITVAGVTFSMTMLTLQLASSQFGPRMLRNFMRDRGNQIVLGTFLSTFVYCLLVLASVRGSGNSVFVPVIAVTFGMILAVASLATLIYFIHHIATSIRIETILARLAVEARPGRGDSSLGFVLAAGSVGAILGAILAGFVALHLAGSVASFAGCRAAALMCLPFLRSAEPCDGEGRKDQVGGADGPQAGVVIEAAAFTVFAGVAGAPACQ